MSENDYENKRQELLIELATRKNRRQHLQLNGGSQKELKALQVQIDILQHEIDELSSQISNTETSNFPLAAPTDRSKVLAGDSTIRPWNRSFQKLTRSS
jgi:hypothetical protein